MGSVNGDVMQVPQKQGLEVRLHLGLAENLLVSVGEGEMAAVPSSFNLQIPATG